MNALSGHCNQFKTRARYADVVNGYEKQSQVWVKKVDALEKRDDEREKKMQNALEEIRKLQSQMSAQ